MPRTYDVVLLGATGFTGALTAGELAARAPKKLRWALAGRNRAALEAVRSDLGLDVDLLHADITDPRSLRELAESTRVLVTTVGPYATLGGAVVAACAAAGTDYLDLTGEPEFVDRTYVEHHATAVSSGARLVHACGFDSIPYDLGVQFTVEQLPEDVPITVRGYVRASGMASGGTLRSAVTGLARARQNVSAFRARRAIEPGPAGGRVVLAEVPRPHRALGVYALPLVTLDPFVVRRSAAALERYGPRFTYGHYAGVQQLKTLAGVGAAATVGGLPLALAAQLPPVRDLMLEQLDRLGGPSEARRERGWFSVKFIGEGGGRRVVTEVSGGDPGYGETAKMLAEAALCLAGDTLPSTAGQVTTAVAMGPKLRRRLEKAGIGFDVREGAPQKRAPRRTPAAV